MELTEVVFLPFRITTAVTRTALALGGEGGAVDTIRSYGPQLRQIFGPGGLVENLNGILSDERGVVSLGNTVADLTSADRPIGQALAPGGLIDRLADENGPFMRLLADNGPVMRLLAEGGPLVGLLDHGGPVDRLLGEDGPLYRFLAPDGPLDRLLSKGGAIEHVLEPGGLIDQLLEEQGILEKLLQPGGTLEQLVGLGDTFADLLPIIDELHHAVEVLNRTVEPLGAIAGRVPIGRRRSLRTRHQVSEAPPSLEE
jgi:hypothetical protein